MKEQEEKAVAKEEEEEQEEMKEAAVDGEADLLQDLRHIEEQMKILLTEKEQAEVKWVGGVLLRQSGVRTAEQEVLVLIWRQIYVQISL